MDARGLVVWLVARDDGDVQWFRDEAPRLLDAALNAAGNASLPMVLMRPRHATPEVVNYSMRVIGLLSFAQHEIQDAGSDAFQAFRDNETTQLIKLLDQLPRTMEAIVPERYRLLPALQTSNSMYNTIETVFKAAFQDGPRSFFTNYSVGHTNLRNAVSQIAKSMSDGTITGAASAISAQPVPRDLIANFLKSPRGWKLLDGNYAIQLPPADSTASPGWQVLDQHIRHGSKGVALSEVLTILLNASYGYDVNTLTLLFAAWYGYNRHELELSVAGKLRPLHEVIQATGGVRRPADIVADLGRSTISRTNPSELEDELNRLLRIEPRSIDQQRRAIAIIDLLVEDPRQPDEKKDTYRNRRRALLGAITSAEKYESNLNNLAAITVGQDRNYKDYVDALKLLQELGSPPQQIRVSGPTPAEVRSQLNARLEAMIGRMCQQYTGLPSLEKFGLWHGVLFEAQRQLATNNLPGLAARVEETIQKLQAEKAQLEDREKDEPIRQKIDAMHVDSKVALSTLDDYQRQLAAFNPVTTAVKSLVTKKRGEVSAEIDKVLAIPGNLEQKLSAATEARAIRSIRDNALEVKWRFAGLPSEEAVNAVIDRANTLEQVLEQGDTVRRSRLEQPSDFDALSAQLNQLISDSRAVLGPAQESALMAIRAELKLKRDAKEQEAAQWLSDMERRFDEAVDPFELRSALRTAHAFLHTGYVDRLERLRQAVEHRIVEDEEQLVEHHFMLIADPDRQEALLERLRLLIGASVRA
jgi:hypothetical protein